VNGARTSSGRVRAAVAHAGLALSQRLGRLGPKPERHARRLTARLAGDRCAYVIDGTTIGGSVIHHGPTLYWMSRAGLAPFHPFQLQLYTDALAPGMVVVDCGAHIGVYTLLAAQRVGAAGTVVALEPDEQNLWALRQNLDANGVAARVEVIGAAASDRPGMARFFAFDDGVARALGSFSPTAGGDPIDVPCVTLDQALAGRRVDVVKIDVEGAETLVLTGAGETLARSPGATLFIECHPPELGGRDPSQWLGSLRQWGSLELIDEPRRRLAVATDDQIARTLGELPQWLPLNVRLTVGERRVANP
jgi:FkbM family methyltransferase